MEIHRKDGEVENRPKSKGGKWFDAITYGGIAGIGTFVVTLPIAYWQKYTPGRKFYHGAAEFLHDVGVNKEVAVNAVETTNLMHGGNLMLLPVLAMEHFRTPIVTGLNRLFNDPTDPESVKDAPNQTFGSVLKGRIVAWSAVFAGMITAGKLIPTQMHNFEEKMGQLTCKVLKQPVVQDSKAYRYGKLAALDIFATASAASLLYISSHFFAKRKVEKREHQVEPVSEVPGAVEAKPVSYEKTTPTADVPTTTIRGVEHESALVTTAPQPQVAAL